MSVTDDKSTKILLIEDDEADVFLVREILSHAPSRFEIRSAPSLADAEKILAQYSPDIILLDLTLPDASGLACFERLKATSGAIPVVILSNATDEELALSAVRKGAQDFLVKGRVESMRLARIVRYAVERAKLAAAVR